MSDSMSQHCPNCEAQAAEIDYWKAEARSIRKELKSEQKSTDNAMDNYDAGVRRIEAQAAEIERLREEAAIHADDLEELCWIEIPEEKAALEAAIDFLRQVGGNRAGKAEQ
jgi:hypothetical protein